MSSQQRQPTHVGMTLGSTTRNGGEFEFRKISLSLERDLVPAENPVDAYRDIKALLERMVTEFQGSRPAGNANQAATPRLPVPKLATLQERLRAHLQDVEITDGIDGLIVKPRRYLGDAWKDVNDVVRELGGKWFKGAKPAEGCWRIPK